MIYLTAIDTCTVCCSFFFFLFLANFSATNQNGFGVIAECKKRLFWNCLSRWNSFKFFNRGLTHENIFAFLYNSDFFRKQRKKTYFYDFQRLSSQSIVSNWRLLKCSERNSQMSLCWTANRIRQIWSKSIFILIIIKVLTELKLCSLSEKKIALWIFS